MAEIEDHWRNPMPEETAMRVLGLRHFNWCISKGAAFCSSRADGAWMANERELYGAYMTAARIAKAKEA